MLRHRLILFCSLHLAATAALAETVEIPFSYQQAHNYQSVKQSVMSLYQWAQGEYAEHQTEGLFSQYPSDGEVITTTLQVVTDLLAQAELALQAGDTVKASALLYSAEATAYYAAKMPHMLESRVKIGSTNQ